MTAAEDEDWVGARGSLAATAVALVVVVFCYGVRLLIRNTNTRVFVRSVWFNRRNRKNDESSAIKPEEEKICGGESSITEDDLQKFMHDLEGEVADAESPWELVVQKQSPTVSYVANRRDPKDGGPTEYLSVTIFENCSTELVRNFYMDSDFRAEWDKTLVHHEQLEICKDTGREVGRSVKKFPLISAREYVLEWRVWEGRDQSFYCLIKACDHRLAGRHPKYKRVEVYNSRWCIKKVPGRQACELSMIHQEDIGMRRELAQLAFKRGIWAYVTKMDYHMRQYSLRTPHLLQGLNAVALAQKVPPKLEEMILKRLSKTEITSVVESGLMTCDLGSKRKLAKRMLLLGGVMFVMRGSSPWGVKFAAACIVNRVIQPKKLFKHQSKS